MPDLLLAAVERASVLAMALFLILLFIRLARRFRRRSARVVAGGMLATGASGLTWQGALLAATPAASPVSAASEFLFAAGGVAVLFLFMYLCLRAFESPGGRRKRLRGKEKEKGR